MSESSDDEYGPSSASREHAYPELEEMDVEDPNMKAVPEPLDRDSSGVQKKRFGTLRMKHREIPAGYEIRYTMKGNAYIANTGLEEKLDQDAENEHLRKKFHVWVSRKKLGENFGIGIYLYYDYVRFLATSNLILILVGFIPFLLHFMFDYNWNYNLYHLNNATTVPEHAGVVWRNVVGNLDVLFTYSYGRGATGWQLQTIMFGWLFTMILSMFLWFFFAVLYFIRIIWKERNSEIFETIKSDEIKENANISKSARFWRTVMGYFLFFLVLCIAALVSAVIHFIRMIYVSLDLGLVDTFDILISVFASITIVLSNWFWRRVCNMITTLERHKTWSQHRKHQTIKYFCFKMVNVTMLYVMKYVFLRMLPLFINFLGERNVIPWEIKGDSCELGEVALQFIALILIDITFVNFIEIIIPILWHQIYSKRKARSSMKSDESFKEYLELLYRQYLIYLATPVFPLMAIFGFIGNVAEFYLDKWRMLNVCQHPHPLNHGMKKFLALYMTIIAILAIIVPPYGVLWIIWQVFFARCAKYDYVALFPWDLNL